MRALISSPRLVAALGLWLMVAVGSAMVLANVQRAGRRNIDARFEQRVTVAGRFIGTYADDLMRQETRQGRAFLSSRRVGQADLNRIAQASGFLGAVVLDGYGRALATYPRRPELIGTDLTRRYAHLQRAIDGKRSISQVVPSATRGGLPVVGFALPFYTPYGRRVISGAQQMGSTATGAYLRNAVTIPGARLYLIDAAGVIIARNGPAPSGVRRISAIEPALARAMARIPTGSFANAGGQQRYVSGPIPGTPWRVAVVAPSAALYGAADGAIRWVPWLVLLGFVAASLAAVILVARIIEGRRSLRELNARLEESVRIDVLTGLFNRRGLDEHLIRATSTARRHQQPLSVLLLDIDRFKRINDTHGHLAGDAVLTELAAQIAGVTRSEDVVGRWGGEEFLVVLPDTDIAAAVGLAERLRERIAGHAFALPDGTVLSVTVSIGVETGVQATRDDLVGSADVALYEAKEAGRDRVVAARSPTPVA